MSSFWSDALAAKQQVQPELTRPPMIPQNPQSSNRPTWDGLLSEAEEALKGPEPAASVAERFGQAPGQDIVMTPSRKPVSSYTDDGEQRQHQRQVNAVAAQRAVQLGMVGEGGQRHTDRMDTAWLVQRLNQSGEYTTATDSLPRRVSSHAIAATRGHTVGHG